MNANPFPQSTPPPEVIDLRLVARRLPAQHAKLAKAIRQWIDAHSIESDMRLAAVQVREAFRLIARPSMRYATTALLHCAVLAYGRAVDRTSEHRSHVSFLDRLTADQAKVHARLVDIRHEALAHFGPAGSEKAWSEDIAVLIVEGMHWQPAAAARRSLFDKAFAGEFLGYLEAIEGPLCEIVEQRRVKFQAMLQDAAEQSQEVADLLAACRIDPASLGEAGQMILSGPRSGGRAIGEFRDN